MEYGSREQGVVNLITNNFIPRRPKCCYSECSSEGIYEGKYGKYCHSHYKTVKSYYTKSINPDTMLRWKREAEMEALVNKLGQSTDSSEVQ